jgi:hypothetical protein
MAYKSSYDLTGMFSGAARNKQTTKRNELSPMQLAINKYYATNPKFAGSSKATDALKVLQVSDPNGGWGAPTKAVTSTGSDGTMQGALDAAVNYAVDTGASQPLIDFTSQESEGSSTLSDSETVSGTSTGTESVSGTGITTTTRGNSEVNNILRSLAASAPAFFQQFSKDSAIKDSQGAVDRTVSDILNRGIPGISSSQTIAGGYNDTTTKLLTDNLVAQAAGEGAKVQLGTINDYAGRTTEAASILNQVLQTGQNATSTSVDEQDQTGSSATSDTETRDLSRIVADLQKALTTSVGPSTSAPAYNSHSNAVNANANTSNARTNALNASTNSKAVENEALLGKLKTWLEMNS